MKLLTKFQAYLALNCKKNEARALFRKDGLRRFIIPFNDGSLEVLTKDEALSLRDQGQLARDLTAKTIFGLCIFFTASDDPTSRTSIEMPAREQKRRRQYFYKWFENHHS